MHDILEMEPRLKYWLHLCLINTCLHSNCDPLHEAGVEISICMWDFQEWNALPALSV